jgi:hypothetical protein
MKRFNGQNDKEVPLILAFRTDPLRDLLSVWREKNPGVNWTWMLRQAVLTELKPYATKRHGHLYEGVKPRRNGKILCR